MSEITLSTTGLYADEPSGPDGRHRSRYPVLGLVFTYSSGVLHQAILLDETSGMVATRTGVELRDLRFTRTPNRLGTNEPEDG